MLVRVMIMGMLTVFLVLPGCVLRGGSSEVEEKQLVLGYRPGLMLGLGHQRKPTLLSEDPFLQHSNTLPRTVDCYHQ